LDPAAPGQAGAGGSGGVVPEAKSSLMRISTFGFGGVAQVVPARTRLPSWARAVS
jgi:hypothetical protein